MKILLLAILFAVICVYMLVNDVPEKVVKVANSYHDAIQKYPEALRGIKRQQRYIEELEIKLGLSTENILLKEGGG